jgi:hypothetical protein
MASSELLAQIQSGKRLKKAVTNDRSAPQVDTAKGAGGGAGRGSAASGGGGPGLGGIAAAIAHNAPQAGSMLLAGGAKLKPLANAALGISVRLSSRVRY